MSEDKNAKTASNERKASPFESSIVFFPCGDIARTRAFYEGVLGLELALSQGGGKSLIFDTGRGFIGFVEYGDGRPMPTGELSPCISFNCEDRAAVDAAFIRVRDAGAEVIAPPVRHPRFAVYSCFFRDPDGYKVELQKIE